MIISLVLKATAIVVVGLASARLARTGRASVRHAILVAMFASLAALPVAALALPTFGIELPIDDGASLPPGLKPWPSGRWMRTGLFNLWLRRLR